MRTIDFPRQFRIIAPGQYISRFLVPAEGQVSRIDGQFIVVVKDYTNQPTISQLDLQFGNNVFNLMANQLYAVDTFAGVAVAPVVSLKETDLGIEVHDFFTKPGAWMTLTVTFTVVPDPFMLYMRPRFIVSPFQQGPKPNGGRQEVGPESAFKWPFIQHTAEPAMGMPNPVVAGIEVVKETVKQ